MPKTSVTEKLKNVDLTGDAMTAADNVLTAQLMLDAATQEDSPFDDLSWGNDDGTSCEAIYKELRIYLVCSEKGEYWRICSVADDYDLIKEGWGEDNLRVVFNQLVNNPVSQPVPIAAAE